MTSFPDKVPTFLFLFSDTGGGHRSAAEAVIEALRLEYGDQVGNNRYETGMLVAKSAQYYPVHQGVN